METLLAFVIGGLYAAGIYMILRRSVVKVIFGLVFLSHAANLLIFTAGDLTREQPPIIPESSTATTPPEPFADPLPQALVLTAIVISFAILAFTVVLVHRMYQETDTDDLNELRATDQ